MKQKFERSQFSPLGINSENLSDVPNMDSFKHIVINAQKGNEMALLILDEWLRYCKPKNTEEELIMDMIKSAADKLFK